MASQACTLFTVAVVFSNIFFSSSVPVGEQKQSSTSSYLSASSSIVDKECITTITIRCNGVADMIQVPCSECGQNMVQIDDAVAYGEPKKDSFCLYSDGTSAPGTLVVIENGQCTLRTYTNKESKPTSTSMSDHKCKEVQEKIENLYLKVSTGSSVLDDLLQNMGQFGLPNLSLDDQ